LFGVLSAYDSGLMINECADPAVAMDMTSMIGKLVPRQATWLHEEGNSAAHVKASLVGSCVMVPVVDGALMLGRWQGIFLCEIDGSRTREVWVQVYS
jgi:secondary thiamine-phosphate synthase enzyme